MYELPYAGAGTHYNGQLYLFLVTVSFPGVGALIIRCNENAVLLVFKRRKYSCNVMQVRLLLYRRQHQHAVIGGESIEAAIDIAAAIPYNGGY